MTMTATAMTITTASPATAAIQIQGISGAGTSVTIRLNVPVWVLPPPVAVMVMVLVPAAVLSAVERVSVDVRAGAPEDGSKSAVASDGRPEADRLTDSAKPPEPVIETVTSADCPAVTDAEAGVKLRAKSGGTAGSTPIIICGMC